MKPQPKTWSCEECGTIHSSPKYAKMTMCYNCGNPKPEPKTDGELSKLFEGYEVIETNHLYHHEHDKEKLITAINKYVSDRERIAQGKGFKDGADFAKAKYSAPKPKKFDGNKQ